MADLKKEEKEKLEEEIKSFVMAELEVDINNLQIQLLIKFMKERFGAYFYAQGLRDAKDYLTGEFNLMAEGVQDLEADF